MTELCESDGRRSDEEDFERLVDESDGQRYGGFYRSSPDGEQEVAIHKEIEKARYSSNINDEVAVTRSEESQARPIPPQTLVLEPSGLTIETNRSFLPPSPPYFQPISSSPLPDYPSVQSVLEKSFEANPPHLPYPPPPMAGATQAVAVSPTHPHARMPYTKLFNLLDNPVNVSVSTPLNSEGEEVYMSEPDDN